MVFQGALVSEHFVAVFTSKSEFVFIVIENILLGVIGDIVQCRGNCSLRDPVRVLVPKDHLHHAATLPFIAAVVISVDNSHVANIALLVHEDLAALLTRVSMEV